MIVRLSHPQARAVMLRVSEPYAEAMLMIRVIKGRTQHDYDLPAIAWRKILDAMIACCYGPVGGKLKDRGRPSDSAYKAISRIADGVKRIENHPALSNASVEGWVGDVIPVWHDSCAAGHSALRQFYAYPRQSGPSPTFPFLLLTPQHVENLGMRITRWSPADNVGTYVYQEFASWTFREESHLAFVDLQAKLGPNQ